MQKIDIKNLYYNYQMLNISNLLRHFGTVLTGETEQDYLYQIINKNYNATNSVS